MSDLECKLNSDLAMTKASAWRVAACRFPLPGWKPAGIVGAGIDSVWLYLPERSVAAVTTEEQS